MYAEPIISTTKIEQLVQNYSYKEFVINRQLGCIVYITTVNVVKVSLRMDTTPEQFYQNNGAS
jgi:hypothetical protein